MGAGMNPSQKQDQGTPFPLQKTVKGGKKTSTAQEESLKGDAGSEGIEVPLPKAHCRLGLK